MKLISADLIKEKFNSLRGKSFNEMKVIDEIPEFTAKFTNGCCSNCGYKLHQSFKYCPDCGAKLLHIIR